MVAPTRTPQARGVKCNLCKNILAQATWLDQTKLAKNVEEAQAVLALIKQHDKTDCPCIPNSIQNLLVGSTHFEIHRLKFKTLDLLVFKKQIEYHSEAKQKAIQERKKRPNENINDCNENFKNKSRFKVFLGHLDAKFTAKSQQLRIEHLKHLSHAIDFWKIALEDQANPFNSKLALRLGLTHHVIYACYLYKYYRLFDYQLISANLLVELFKSIEGVTTNANIHASYILIKTLIDCNQLSTARHYLKQANKLVDEQNKNNYEYILFSCVSFELDLLENNSDYEAIEELAQLAIIKSDDKLQHYYARTLALSTVIKYIHHYPGRSDLCFEFYHTFRYSCAIIRKCYQDCFELLLSEKELSSNNVNQQQQIINEKQSAQPNILEHSWIRFAGCDFVFSTFNLISNFYIKSGQPAVLDLLYNGLNMVAFRSGSYYWQVKMAAIGVELDLLCDKYDDAKTKVSIISHVIGGENNQHLMNLLRLNSEVSSLLVLSQQNETFIKPDVIKHLLERIKSCSDLFQERIVQIELYDSKSNSNFKLNANQEADSIVLAHDLSQFTLKVLKIGVVDMLRTENIAGAYELVQMLSDQVSNNKHLTLDYYDCQTILEILLLFADIDKSELVLLDSVHNSQLFLENDNSLINLDSQLSSLTLEEDKSSYIGETTTLTPGSPKTKKKVKPKLSMRPLRRKAAYDVASRTEEGSHDCQSTRIFDTLEALKNFNTLSKEEIVVTYLRNSEPNPDYDLYRRCHELMFSFKLKEEGSRLHDQLIYHFTESNTSNTMRYRWMMFEEQQVSPFESENKKSICYKETHTKHLSFTGSMIKPNKTVKTMLQSIPTDTRLIQIKHIINERTKKEHLLISCMESKQEPFYVHVEKPITSDDILKQTTDISDCQASKILTQIEEAKKTLFVRSQRERNERRKSIESQLGVLLHDLEDEWLGPFRILMGGGKIKDVNYDKLVRKVEEEILRIMNQHNCYSEPALRFVIENGPLVSRDEFCQLLGSIFNCPANLNELRECFNWWLKLIEIEIKGQAPGLSKTNYLLKLARGQLGLILDRSLEALPLESLPQARVTKQAIFRVPSLRLFEVIWSRMQRKRGGNLEADVARGCYMLDPGNDLAKTRERFEAKLRAQKSWSGRIGEAPSGEQLEEWLSRNELYIYIGHGAGSAYYNKLCKGRGLSWMKQVSSLAIVMGCSSGRLMAEGPRLESFGVGWLFVLRGSPAYLGLLWDVTDTDIDRFLEALLADWLRSRWSPRSEDSFRQPSISGEQLWLAAATARARQVCEFRFLIGSAPVIYGISTFVEANK